MAICEVSRKEFFRLLHEIKGHSIFLCTLTRIKTMYKNWIQMGQRGRGSTWKLFQGV